MKNIDQRVQKRVSAKVRHLESWPEGKPRKANIGKNLWKMSQVWKGPGRTVTCGEEGFSAFLLLFKKKKFF